MAISKPQLPPKTGYVEVEADGIRTYMNVETGELYGQESAPEPTTGEILNAMLGVTDNG